MFSTTETAKVIREKRIEKNMTQMQLADALGISYQAVSNWERGNSMPDISKLGELAPFLAKETLDAVVERAIKDSEAKVSAHDTVTV